MIAALKAAFGVKSWPEYTREEVAKHNTLDSLWLVAGDKVFDATLFVGQHPGGRLAVIKRGGGCSDCTEDYKFHSKGAREQWKQLQIGVLSGDALRSPVPPNAAPDAVLLERNTLSRFKSEASVGSFVSSTAQLIAPSVPAAVIFHEGDGGEDVSQDCCQGAPGERCLTCPRHQIRSPNGPVEGTQLLRR